MSELITPIVHLNGTSAESLLEQREQVYCKLGEVFEAFKQMAPNGRATRCRVGSKRLKSSTAAACWPCKCFKTRSKPKWRPSAMPKARREIFA